MKKLKNLASLVIFSFVLILSFKISIVKSQSTNSDDQYSNTKFNPSVAIVVVILVVALFLMSFFSIYARRRGGDVNNSNSNSVRRNGVAMMAQQRSSGGTVAIGLEAAVVEMFPTFTYSEVKDHKIGKGVLECAVCLNEFEDDETLRLIPKCDHVFHPECIDPWLESHVTCPVCRTNLTPQGGDEPYSLPELNQENNDVSVQVDVVEEDEVKPDVNRILSFKHSNRKPRTGSLKIGGRNVFGLGKFRSHSTGHLFQPGENMDRFTLRLPEEFRKEMMNRVVLNRTKSVAVPLPRDGSTTRRWFGTGLGEGSSKGISSLAKIEEPDRISRPDRWFFSRKVSMKLTKVLADNLEASTSTIAPMQGKSEPKNIDEKSLLNREPVQL